MNYLQNPSIRHVNNLLVAAEGLEELLKGKLQPLGISFRQYKMMAFIRAAENRTGAELLTQRELALSLDLQQMDTSHRVRHLEGMRLVSRVKNTADHRAISLTLTPEGKAFLLELDTILSEWCNECLMLHKANIQEASEYCSIF